jgi:hypothetical protein
VEWVLARDLLAAGLRASEGIGDVRAWPSAASCDPAAAGAGAGTGVGAAAGSGILNIAMSSPFGQAQFETSARAVEEFLARTYAVVPAGQEPAYLDIDADLAELLSQALPTRGGRGRAIGPGRRHVRPQAFGPGA